MLRSTPTGISAVVDARGGLVKSLPWRTAGVIDAVLPPPANSPPPFARLGNLIPILLGFALVAWVLRTPLDAATEDGGIPSWMLLGGRFSQQRPLRCTTLNLRGIDELDARPGSRAAPSSHVRHRLTRDRTRTPGCDASLHRLPARSPRTR